MEIAAYLASCHPGVVVYLDYLAEPELRGSSTATAFELSPMILRDSTSRRLPIKRAQGLA